MNKRQLARLETARLQLEKAWQTVRDLAGERAKEDIDDDRAWLALSEADGAMASAWIALNTARAQMTTRELAKLETRK